MFYKYILDKLENNTYTSLKPPHHIKRYYNELKYLETENVIKKVQSSKIIPKGYNYLQIIGSVYEIIDLEKLEKLAVKEQIKPYYFYQKNKLVSYLNKYNQQDWVNCWTTLKFDKGRCNAPVAWATTENDIKGIHQKDRYCFNNEYFGENNWYHFDVPSSIPQVIHLFNKGYWYGKRVWDELGSKYKDYSMRLIFNNSPYKVAKSIYNANMQELGMKGFYGLKKDDSLVNIAEQIKQKLETIIGSIDHFGEKNTELFIHESNIYLMVLDKFIDNGAKVYSVYDSFYWNIDSGITKETVADWVKECAEYYYSNYSELMEKEEKIFNDLKAKQEMEQKERKKAYQKAYEHTEKRKAYEHTEKRKKDRHKNGKVYKWVLRNPGSTNYPAKWNENDIEYFNQLIGGNRND